MESRSHLQAPGPLMESGQLDPDLFDDVDDVVCGGVDSLEYGNDDVDVVERGDVDG